MALSDALQMQKFHRLCKSICEGMTKDLDLLGKLDLGENNPKYLLGTRTEN